jgi:ubiquinone/menaquinone biosynthesis C-methylase UbiE
MARTSDRSHWDRFWERERDLSDIYDNDNRISIEVCKRLNIKNSLILEVGAATARDSVSLAVLGALPVALDYSHAAMKLAREAAREKNCQVLLVCGDANELPFKTDTFHLVFHQGVMEHFHNTDPMTDECVRVTRPGGTLLVDVPQTLHIYTVIKKILIALNAWFAGWETQYTPRQLEAYLRNHGVEPWALYGRYFSPSLCYRILREILMKINVKLPLRPVFIPFIHKFRSSLRTKIEESPLGLNTGVVIGVFARKPEKL